MAFLQELCSLSKHLHPSGREEFLQKAIGLGLFKVLGSVLARGPTSACLRATDILLTIIEHDPQVLRAYLVTDGAGKAMFSSLIAVLEVPAGKEDGLQEQVGSGSGLG